MRGAPLGDAGAGQAVRVSVMSANEAGQDGKGRILFITLSCIGDAIMTTPVLQALHTIKPDATIDIVADQRSSILFSCCPYRGDIIHKDKNRILRGGLDLVRTLRRRSYDLVVDLRTDGIAYLLKARERYTRWRRQPYGAHAVEDFMGVIRPLYGDKALPGTAVWSNREHARYADSALSSLPGKRWLAMAPGVSAPSKQWSPVNYAKLANSLNDKFSGVILLGSAQESTVTTAVQKELLYPSVDLAGADLLQTAAVLQRARIFVGSDSGLGHLAAATRTPTLTLFGMDFPERCLPWGGQASWLKGEDSQVASIRVTDAEASLRSLIAK